MFLGTYEPKLDDKGRLILPAKYRDQLADGLVITRGQEHCLYVFKAEDFMQMQEDARKAPLSNREAPTTCGCSSREPSTRSPTARDGSPCRRTCGHMRVLNVTLRSSARATASRSGISSRGTASWRNRKPPSRSETTRSSPEFFNELGGGPFPWFWHNSPVPEIREGTTAKHQPKEVP